MAEIKYTILKKGQSLRTYDDGYPKGSYKNLNKDVKVEIEKSLIRYVLTISVDGVIIVFNCTTFKIQEDPNE